MASKKIILNVCRSCVRDNRQTEACFTDQETLRKTYERKLKKGLFGKIAELKVMDCLTNCHNPNSVRIDRNDGQILLGWIQNETLINAVVALADTLRNPTTLLEVSSTLKKNLISITAPEKWK